MNFKNYLEEQELFESLNTPVEFYMTDDTEIPKQIYGAFELNGTDYGISLVLTGYSKVYQLDFYRIVNVKKRMWAFKTAADIRPCLSTVIKFIESCLPFIQQKMDGLIIDLPKKAESTKYQKFMQKMINKTYVRRYVPQYVTKKTDKAQNYMFLVKKGIKPESLFKTVTFTKHFDFSQSVPAEVLDEAKPYKHQKTSVSKTPSKKYVFDGIGMEYVADEDMVNTLDKAKKTDVAQSAKEKVAQLETSKPKEKDAGTKTNLSKDDENILSSFNVVKDYFNPNENKAAIAAILSINGLEKAFDIINKKGFDPSKFNFDNFKYVAQNGFHGMPPEVQAMLQKAGLFDTHGALLKDADYWKSVSEKMAEPEIQVMRESWKKITSALNKTKEVIKQSKYDFDWAPNLDPNNILTVLYNAGSFTGILYRAKNAGITKSSDVTSYWVKNLGYDLRWLVSDNPTKIPNEVIDWLKSNGYLTSFSKVDTSNAAMVEKWVDPIRMIVDLQAQGKLSDIKMASAKTAKKLEITPPKSTVAGFETSNETTNPLENGVSAFGESNEDAGKKKESIWAMPEISAWREKAHKQMYGSPNEENAGAKMLNSYTGPYASDMNHRMRKWLDVKTGNFNTKAIKSNGSIADDVKTLMKYFQSAPRLENGIWVYRNADIPHAEQFDVGDDIIDAGFLSTTVRSDMGLGDGGNTRLKIYLPKGTQCFPVFDSVLSQHSGEDEIVLPPLSIIKATEIYRPSDSNKNNIVGIYTGSASNDFYEKVVAVLKEGGISEQIGFEKFVKELIEMSDKEMKDDENKSKWAQSMNDKNTMDKLSKLIKSGKLKKNKFTKK